MTAIDPVCGMSVEEGEAAGAAEYQGKTYYFCSPGCKIEFEADPDRFLSEG
jgi:YHS domain-containing protein